MRNDRIRSWSHFPLWKWNGERNDCGAIDRVMLLIISLSKSKFETILVPDYNSLWKISRNFAKRIETFQIDFSSWNSRYEIRDLSRDSLILVTNWIISKISIGSFSLHTLKNKVFLYVMIILFWMEIRRI